MAYVGNDPFQNKSVDTAQLADNAVTGEKIVDDITFDDITTTGNVSGSVSSTGSYGRVEATKVEGTLATAAQTNVTSVGTVTTGVWNSSFGTTSGTQISGSITATSSSIATRFDSRETDMTLATASIVSNESNMTLATASIAAITASISTTKTDISTNTTNMTLATASIAAITSSVSTAKTDISTNSANMTLATASIAAITASVSSLKTTSFAGTAGTETVFSGSVASTGSFGRVEATRLSGDGADITGLTAPAITAIASAGANQILTDDGDATVTSEANLTFDGTDLTVEAGDIVFGAAGKGICLGVTSNTDSNTLDDYEEGTWTAAVVEVAGGGDTALTMRAGEDTGYYTKVGNLVTVSGFFGTSSLNGLSSEMVRITGLPFTVADNDAALSGGGAAYATGNGITAGESSAYYGQRGDTYIHLTVWDATSGTSAMLASEWGADGRIIIGFSYRAA